jgi:hypothetical protein
LTRFYFHGLEFFAQINDQVDFIPAAITPEKQLWSKTPIERLFNPFADDETLKKRTTKGMVA